MIHIVVAENNRPPGNLLASQQGSEIATVDRIGVGQERLGILDRQKGGKKVEVGDYLLDSRTRAYYRWPADEKRNADGVVEQVRPTGGAPEVDYRVGGRALPLDHCPFDSAQGSDRIARSLAALADCLRPNVHSFLSVVATLLGTGGPPIYESLT